MKQTELPPYSHSDVCLLFFDSKGRRVEIVLEHNINLDLLNIRHFRSLLSDYFKQNRECFTYLVIKPAGREIDSVL